jgi:predicted TIM-barrel fold metal-dependent hydrolase
MLGKTYDTILQAVDEMPVIDTHEHLPHGMGESHCGEDILGEYLTHYLSSDLVSAGLRPDDLAKALDPSLPLMERWDVVEPYWEVSRYTGYGRALDIAVRDIYGFDSICRETIEELNQAFQEKNHERHLRYVLKDLCNIEISILDIGNFGSSYDPNLYRCAWRPEDYIRPYTDEEGEDSLERIEKAYGSEVQSLDNLVDAFEGELELRLSQGIVALKIGLAYVRPLRFDKVDYTTAKRSFAGAIRKWRQGDTEQGSLVAREVQDFMMHHVLQVASEKQLVFQIHTGLQEGNGNTISNSDPALLNNLFLDYPDVTFDLFHIGYPYQGVTCVLAKNFPNVFIDMCWAHIISPSIAVHALSDFLDAVPYNKISGFGGDYCFVDGVYGHLYMARRNIARALAQKVADGVFSTDTAIKIAHSLLYDNPRRIFRLEEI